MESSTFVPDRLDDVLTEQRWDEYDEIEHETWRMLYDRRMTELEDTASRAFLNGARLIGLRRERVPSLAEVNRRLEALTGWSAIPGTASLRRPFSCSSRDESAFAGVSRCRWPVG